MSKQNLNYEDGIPEEILWNPETNSFMKRSLFPGKWIPARISVWDADNPKATGQKIVRIPAMPVKVLPGKPHKFRFRRTIKKARNIMVGMY